MPKAAPKPCRHPGCGKLVTDGTGYCAAHQADRNVGRFSDKKRGSRHERGYGTEWDRLRKWILQRDKGLCQPCLAGGRVSAANQVDHKTPRAEGGTDEEQNLQAICAACHREKTAAEAARGCRRGGGH